MSHEHLPMLIVCALIAGCQHPANLSTNESYRFKSLDGSSLSFDPAKGEMTVDGSTMLLSDCSNAEYRCWDSEKVKLVVPKTCGSQSDSLTLIPNDMGMRVFGVDAHSDAVTWAKEGNMRFAYAYSKKDGIVSITYLKPSDKSLEGSYPLERVYYTSNRQAVMPCLVDSQ